MKTCLRRKAHSRGGYSSWRHPLEQKPSINLKIVQLRRYDGVLSDHQTISPPFTFPGFLFLKVSDGEDDKRPARSSRDKFYSDLSKPSPPPRVQHSALEIIKFVHPGGNGEQPYDSIPNFSAADALRLTGIGRNEFIDIMNKCRSKNFMWKLNKSIAKELLLTQPVDFPIEPWWGVCLVNFTLEEFKKLSEEEMATIDKICKEEANAYVLFDPEVVKGLYLRGLIYFDVPVYADDRFKGKLSPFKIVFIISLLKVRKLEMLIAILVFVMAGCFFGELS
ncbi:hypothetical protein ACFE04_000781 [Oxalis oulophora]